MSAKSKHAQHSNRRAVHLAPLVIACLFLLSISASAQLKPTKRVLIFTEFGFSSPAIAAITQEIRSSLETDPKYHIDLYSEALETSLFSDETSQQDFRAWYVRKYRDRKPDVMIAVGPEPIAFLASYHAVFFPDVPVVFCASSREEAHNPKLDSNFTGSWLKVQPDKTLDLALRLLPATKRVVVVGGVGPFDRGVEALTRDAIDYRQSTMEIVYLTELEMPLLLDRMRQLPKDSVILFTSLTVDSSGRHFINVKQSAPMVAAAADVPVFGMADVFMGTGSVGGYVVSYTGQGQLVAQMIKQILAGESAAAIPIVEGLNTSMVDWRALQRFGLSQSRLPKGTTVLFRQPTIWETYPHQIVATLLVLFALLLLSIYLLFERRRRRLAESALQSNLAFEELVAELSSNFINIRAEVIDGGIQQALERVLSFFKLDRISVLELSIDGKELLRTYSVSQAVGLPTIDRLTMQSFPWYTATLLNRKKLVIADIRDVVDLSESEKDLFTTHRIGAFASIPLEGEHNVLGALILIMVDSPAQWPDNLVDRLATVGQVFANALVRKRADDTLVSSEMLKESILRALSNSVTVVNEVGDVILTNSHRGDSADPLLQVSSINVGSNYFDACRSAVKNGDPAASEALAGLGEVLDRRQQYFEMEWPYSVSTSLRWSLMTVTPLSHHTQGLVVSFADITFRKQAEEERLELSGRLIRAQEDERSRLARELHDDFNQRLAVLAIDLERTTSVMSDHPTEAIQRMHDLWNRVSEIGADLHSLSHRLHSSTLESLGLVLGVSSLCEDFCEQQQIQVDFAHKGIPRSFSPDAALCMFRIVQEGLRNVKRHSGALRAEVRIEGTADEIHLVLADEGIGFDTRSKSSKSGLGIRSMQERLRILGGRIELRSGPNQGTTIEAWVPLNPVLADEEVPQWSSV